MPHVHADELAAWADVSRDARAQLLKASNVLKKVEAALLLIDQQATAAGEPMLLSDPLDEEQQKAKEVEREVT